MSPISDPAVSGADDPSVVIAAALPRSGSTWLQRILHAGSDIFVWGESKLMYHLEPMSGFAREWDDGEGGRAREAFLAAGQDPTTWVANASPAYAVYREALAAFLRTYYGDRHGKRRYGWKEVKVRRSYLELLWEVFPELRVLLLLRHPVDTLRSMKNAGPRGIELWFDDLETAARTWSAAALEYVALEGDPRVLLLRYEDLPRRLDEVATRLGTGPLGEGEAFRARVGGSRPTLDLDPAERRTVQRCCSEALAAAGYGAS